ncbi:MAG TPA: acyltransferase, partial [Alphaproteobacteria bacterium]|nr:acyltransferase [Alphaproteobacteria bacterium]
MTFEQKFAESGYRPSGFDYQRLILALLVIFIHSFDISYGKAYLWNLPGVVSAAARLIVPMFFFLSGFLVTKSLESCGNILQYLWHRSVRIFPALSVEIFLSAVLLGGLVTTLPLQDYYSSAGFWGYFLNIVGYLHLNLPGVFADNPRPDMVNGQLWTVPPELICYLSLVLFTFIGLIRHRWLLLAFVVAAQLFLAVHYFITPFKFLHSV